MLVTAVSSAAVASAVWSSHDHGTHWAVSDPAQRVAAVQQACEQWTEAEPPDRSELGDEDRCASLANWLTDSLSTVGRSPWTTWATPQRLLLTCRSWLTQTAPDDTTTWCDDFVDWVSTNLPDWDGWLPSDPMAGL